MSLDWIICNHSASIKNYQKSQANIKCDITLSAPRTLMLRPAELILEPCVAVPVQLLAAVGRIHHVMQVRHARRRHGCTHPSFMPNPPINSHA
ncbi:hypothetical protein F0185_02875 [Massilia sp. CCM 8692]|uniref:Uncharacterized protein n=1 Tax=Massilia rubra TaxID=2607910 RepID=A0ABX0LCP5_9BURK|nr:hypothetical protein [Massilia rubra]